MSQHSEISISFKAKLLKLNLPITQFLLDNLANVILQLWPSKGIILKLHS